MNQDFINLFQVTREEIIAAAEFNDEAALTFQDQVVAESFRARARHLREQAHSWFPPMKG